MELYVTQELSTFGSALLYTGCCQILASESKVFSVILAPSIVTVKNYSESSTKPPDHPSHQSTLKKGIVEQIRSFISLRILSQLHA